MFELWRALFLLRVLLVCCNPRFWLISIIICDNNKIYNKHDKTFQDNNKIMKMKDEMNFATLDSNLVEVNNLIVVNSFWNLCDFFAYSELRF